MMANAKSTAKKKDKDLPKLESISRLQIMLSILNDNPDRYVSDSEIEKEFIKRIDPNNKLDPQVLKNSLTNILVYATGITELPPTNPKTGISDNTVFHTAEYLAAIAQVRQTILIERMLLPQDENGKRVQVECYMITLRGIEILNQINLRNTATDIVVSSKRLERYAQVTGLLNIFLVLLTIVLITTTPAQSRSTALSYILLGVLVITLGAEMVILMPNLVDRIIRWNRSRNA